MQQISSRKPKESAHIRAKDKRSSQSVREWLPALINGITTILRIAKNPPMTGSPSGNHTQVASIIALINVVHKNNCVKRFNKFQFYPQNYSFQNYTLRIQPLAWHLLGAGQETSAEHGENYSIL
ncbi:MAG: hypothetical protein WCC12_19665 [Anaerolineales bacterium]